MLLFCTAILSAEVMRSPMLVGQAMAYLQLCLISITILPDMIMQQLSVFFRYLL